MTNQTFNPAEQLAKLIAELEADRAALAAKEKAAQEIVDQLKKDVIADVKATINNHRLTIRDLFSDEEIAMLVPSAQPSATAQPKKAKEEKQPRLPNAIFLNPDLPKDQQLYCGKPDATPEWLDAEARKKYAVLDIAEQIKILREHGKATHVSTREKWLAANPDRATSNLK